MRVVVFGYHDVGCAGLETLVEAGHDVAAVFTHRDDPDEDPWFGSIAELARAHGIPVHLPEDVNAPRWVDRIRGLAPDVVFSFYYRKLLGAEITDLPSLGALNLHGSLLPRYRGRCPVNWVLVRGERETGVTLHHMIARPDAGDIVARRRIAIDPRDTAPSLHRKIVAAAREMLSDVLADIARGAAPKIPQDPSEASYFGRRRPEDGRIDWDRPAQEIDNLVRAVTRPWPGAFTVLGGRKLFVWESGPERPAEQLPPGEVTLADGVRVGTGSGALRIERCQFENQACITGETLATRLEPGTRLG